MSFEGYGLENPGVRKSEKPEGFNLYDRVTEDAIVELRLGGMEDEEIERANAILSDPAFRKKTMDQWSAAAYGSSADPEKQEKLWAKTLAGRVRGMISH